jgi:thioredoxin-related protein
MKYRLFAVFIFAVAFGIYKKAKQNSVKEVSFASIESNVEYTNCLQQKDCFVVYVAPWCPACHQFISYYQQHKDLFKSKGLGFVYVVGADESRQNEIDMKNSLAPEGVLDTAEHAFLKRHKINSFPTILQVNKTGKVLKQGEDVYAYMNDRLNDRK